MLSSIYITSQNWLFHVSGHFSSVDRAVMYLLYFSEIYLVMAISC